MKCPQCGKLNKNITGKARFGDSWHNLHTCEECDITFASPVPFESDSE